MKYLRKIAKYGTLLGTGILMAIHAGLDHILGDPDNDN